MVGVIIFGAIYIYLMYFMLNQLLNKPKINNNELNYIFAPPGQGKTTTLVYIARLCDKYNKNKYNIKHGKHINIYSNIDIQDIEYQKIEKSDLGYKNIHDGIILYDECSIDMNNRDYKSLSHNAIEFLKLHRHYNITMYVFSQSFDDVDITLRRLCSKYFLLKKCLFYKLRQKIYIKSIKKFIDIQKDTKQIIDAYDFKFLGKYTVFARKQYKYFNSYNRPMTLKEF